MKVHLSLFLLLAVTLGAVAGCGGGLKDDPVLRLSAEEALAEGTRLMTERKYRLARKYLIHAFEVQPNSASGRDGLLLAADALFFAGGGTNLVEAESRYRDFLNRFPTSERAAYAQYQIAQCLVRRMEKPNRDQATTRQAKSAFEDLLRLHPTSSYASEAQEGITVAEQRLAEAEEVVAKFYIRYGWVLGAARRYETIVSDYPEFSGREGVLYELCRLYRTEIEPIADGSDPCALLAEEFPTSSYLSRLPESTPKEVNDAAPNPPDSSVASD